MWNLVNNNKNNNNIENPKTKIIKKYVDKNNTQQELDSNIWIHNCDDDKFSIDLFEYYYSIDIFDCFKKK